MFVKIEERQNPSFRENDSKTLDDVSRTILKAAALIEERGLCKGEYTNAKGNFCINGALMFTMYGRAAYTDEYPPSSVYRRLLASFGGDPACFNNEPQRTKDEVVAKLRAVALGL